MNIKKQKQIDPPFSLFRFLGTVSATFLGYGLLLYGSAPSVFYANMYASWWKYVVVFMVAHLCNAFVEYFFHRYVLHMPLVPGLAYFYRQHTRHHDLTNIRLISVRDGTGQVFNRYPILNESQHEASFFPWYTLGAFMFLCSPIIITVQWLLPSWPIAFMVPTAIAFSLVLYELIHAVEHFDFRTFWQPKVTHPRFGDWWTTVYCFHLRHHAHRQTNEGISGFFTIPIPDFLFGTYAPWPRAFVHGELINETSFVGSSPVPRLFIRLLDTAARMVLTWRGIQISR